jgi:hypothetical protein
MDAYINSGMYHGHDNVTICHLAESGDDPFKFTYDLTVKYKYVDNERKVSRLVGYFCGFYINTEAAAKIIFIKLDHINKAEEFGQEYEGVYRPDQIPSASETVKEIYTFLTEDI